jgi:uncharacterized protein
MHITLHLTKSCNMRCSYCYAPPSPDEGMALDVGKSAIEFGKKINKGPCGIVFFGGEPLLYKGLIRELVTHGRELENGSGKSFGFKLTTNGLLLDEEFINYSINNNVMLALSFDGVRSAHDAHRKTPDGNGTYDIVVEKLKLLLKACPYSSVMMVVNPDTAKYLCESVSHVIDLGARYIIVSLNFAGNWRDADLKTLKRQYKKLGDLYIKWTKEERKFYLSPFEVKLSSHINKDTYQKERCELGKHQLSIDPEGNVYPCVQFTKAGRESDWCIGHINTGIDEDKKEKIFQESQSEKNSCEGCAISNRCNNTCGCLNWQTTGGINEISPVLCWNERTLMPIADKIGNHLFKKKNPLFLHKHYNLAYPVISLIEDNINEKKGTL